MAMGDLARWVEHAARELADGLAGADVRWLVLGVLLHLGNQVARGCGWFAVVRIACPAEPVRRRDTVGAWVAGAGAGGVVSSRGGDAVRLLLLHGGTPATGYPVLAGTLVAEGVAEFGVGLVVLVGATSAGLWPGLSLPSAGLLTAAVAVALILGAVICRSALVRRFLDGVARGARVLKSPRLFARTVLPWQLLSRGSTVASLACFLTAFALPATRGDRARDARPEQRQDRAARPGRPRRQRRGPRGDVRSGHGSEAGLAQLAVFVVATSTLLTAVGLALAALVAMRLAGTAATRAASAGVSFAAIAGAGLTVGRSPAANRAAARPAKKPMIVTTTPATMSATKWLPVATTARQTRGAHVHAATRAHGRRSELATAALTATANPACRLGTAAIWL